MSKERFPNILFRVLRKGLECIEMAIWKIVRQNNADWELYNMENDETELNNLATDQPEKVQELEAMYNDLMLR